MHLICDTDQRGRDLFEIVYLVSGRAGAKYRSSHFQPRNLATRASSSSGSVANASAIAVH